ncbi:MAG: SufB/SufD family protein [Sphingomonadales bacterium]|jgi:Fe-S cluster assembly protein SufD
MKNIEVYKSQFDGLFKMIEGEEEAASRLEAFDHFNNIGLPHKKMEDWKYSDTDPFSKNIFELSPHLEGFSPELPPKVTLWSRLVYVDGHLSATLSDETDFEGICFKNKLGVQKAHDQEPLRALNFAMAQGGANLSISKDTGIEGLELLFIFTGNNKNVCHIKNNIALEDGVDFSIFTSFLSPNDIGWVNISTQINIPKNSSLIHMGDLGIGAKSFLTAEAVISIHGGAYENHSLLRNSGSARHLINVDVLGENSNIYLNGAFLAGNNETLDTLTRLNHIVPNSNSEQNYRGVLLKKGKTAFQGKVVVSTNAQKTIAGQSCKNLILEAGAEANVKPELLIYADDVKCAHGATVGELDKEAYFYMLQRGIDPIMAHALLVNSFLGEVIENIKQEDIKTHFESLIINWMHKTQERAS